MYLYFDLHHVRLPNACPPRILAETFSHFAGQDRDDTGAYDAAC
jgi:hypothetical protein